MTTRCAGWVPSHLLTRFYLLAFAISWAGWIPSLAASAGVVFFTHAGWAVTLILPAVGPALAAGLVSHWQQTGLAIGSSLRVLFRWRVPAGWYAFALITPAGVLWVAAVLSQWLPQQPTPAPPTGRGFALYLLLSVLANPWEEVGWRGFALVRLQARYPAVVATSIVGLLGRLWHLPIFLVSAGPISMAALPFWPWFIASMGQSFVLSWLFNRSAGSLVIVSLYHIAMNGYGALVGIPSYWALAGAEVSLAAGLWLFCGPGQLPYQAGAVSGSGYMDREQNRPARL